MNNGTEAVRNDALGLMRNIVLGTNSPKIRIMMVAMMVWTRSNRASLCTHCCKGMVNRRAMAIE